MQCTEAEAPLSRGPLAVLLCNRLEAMLTALHFGAVQTLCRCPCTTCNLRTSDAAPFALRVRSQAASQTEVELHARAPEEAAQDTPLRQSLHL